MEIRVINTNEGFINLKQDWEVLQKQDPDNTYYSTFSFVYNSWTGHHKSNPTSKLYILCAYHNNILSGIAPLMIVRRKKYRFLHWNTLTFISIGDFRGFILKKNTTTDKGVLKTIFDFIFSGNTLFDEVDLANILSKSVLSDFLISHNEYYSDYNFLVECPVLSLDNYSDFNEYQKYFISSYTVKYLKRLKRDFSYYFNIIHKPDDSIIEQIMELNMQEQSHLKLYKGKKERRSIFDRQFFRDLIGTEMKRPGS